MRSSTFRPTISFHWIKETLQKTDAEMEYISISFQMRSTSSITSMLGRVWTKEEFVSVCGLGDVTGLCGANCYHDYLPFIPGISVRTYTDEQLQEMIDEENTPKEYYGKQYTTYEALQEQRRREREIRATRQQVRLLQEGGADEKAIILKKSRYQGQMQNHVDFSRKMGLPEQKQRILQDGLRGRVTPTKRQMIGVMQKNRGEKVLITDQAIEKVQSVAPSDLPSNIAQMLTQTHKELLNTLWMKMKAMRLQV